MGNQTKIWIIYIKKEPVKPQVLFHYLFYYLTVVVAFLLYCQTDSPEPWTDGRSLP